MKRKTNTPKRNRRHIANATRRAAASTNNKPIVTVKLAQPLVVSKEVGPNVKVEMTVADGPKITRINNASVGKWLFQKPVSPSPISVHIKVTEVDPVFTESTSDDKTLSIDFANPPKKGNDKIDITLTAVGGDAGKTAKFTFGFAWFVSSNIEDLAEFIRDKMVNNPGTSQYQTVKTKFDKGEKIRFNPHIAILGFQITETNALLEFGKLVNTNAAWDYKKDILPLYGEWSLDAPQGVWYKYTVWANIHFGYIGRHIGFSEDELLDGAGLARAHFELGESGVAIVAHCLDGGQLRDYDQPEDQAAIRVGMNLWKQHQGGVTVENIIDSMRRTSGLDSKPADEDKPPKSFLEKEE